MGAVPATETLEFTDAHGMCVARLTLFALDAAKPDDLPSLIRLDPATAREQGEEALQLIEGARYEYEFADSRLRLDAADGEPGRLIEASRLAGRTHSGFLSPGLNTGRLGLGGARRGRGGARYGGCRSALAQDRLSRRLPTDAGRHYRALRGLVARIARAYLRFAPHPTPAIRREPLLSALLS
jgi:hypothetical protein